jgi:hypothetical protein
MVGVPAIVFAQLMASRNEQCAGLQKPSSLSSTVFTTIIPPPALAGAGVRKMINDSRQMTRIRLKDRMEFIVISS